MGNDLRKEQHARDSSDTQAQLRARAAKELAQAAAAAKARKEWEEAAEEAHLDDVVRNAAVRACVCQGTQRAGVALFAVAHSAITDSFADTTASEVVSVKAYPQAHLFPAVLPIGTERPFAEEN